MTRKPTFDYDIIVIGTGAGGSPAASITAKSGKRVAIIEEADFGGESPNWGDIPIGAMMHASSVYLNAKQGATFGLRSSTVGYNYPSLLAWRDLVIKRTGVGGNRSYYEKQGIHVFAGRAHFLSPNEITVNRRHLSAQKFLIATGSQWTTPQIPGIADVAYFTPKTILQTTRPPKSLFVVGSGGNASEIANLMAILGSKVYLSETANRILPEYDSEVADVLSEQFGSQLGMTILTGTKVVAVQKEGLYTRITYVNRGKERSVKVDALLIASGHLPQTDIGLENAGVAYDHHGITINSSLATSARHIFAVGTVVDTSMQTHEVLRQSRLAAHNLLRSRLTECEPSPKLSAVATTPRVASIGLSEDDCVRRDRHKKISLVPLTLTAHSNITDQRLGFVKLIADAKGILIGATIVAPDADEIIHELSLAVSSGLHARDIARAPHSFTSSSEAIRIAAGKLL